MSISFDELRQQHFDPDALLYAIRSSMMEQRILAGGEMNVHLRRLVVGNLTINSGDYSFPIFAKGGIFHDHVHIGLLTSASNEVLVNKRVIPLDQLQLYAPGSELHYATHAGAGWAVIELPLARLNAAHRDLLHGNTTSVIEVCERWGFGHAGRFAMDYRALLGESPSETLHRVNNSSL